MNIKSLLCVAVPLLMSTPAGAAEPAARCRIGNGKGARELTGAECAKAEAKGEKVVYETATPADAVKPKDGGPKQMAAVPSGDL